jgi:hypothetical protein
MIQGPEPWDITVIGERQGLTVENDLLLHDWLYWRHPCWTSHVLMTHSQTTIELSWYIVSFHIQAQKFEYPTSPLMCLYAKKGDKLGWLVGPGDKVKLKFGQWNYTEFDQVWVQAEAQGWVEVHLIGPYAGSGDRVEQCKPSNWWLSEARSGKERKNLVSSCESKLLLQSLAGVLRWQLDMGHQCSCPMLQL